MTDYQLWVIAAMAAATALPRVVPAFFIARLRMKGYAGRFFALVPYAALSALVVPDIFSSVPGQPLAGGAGAAAALAAALAGLSPAWAVLGAVAAAYAVQYAFAP